MGLPSHIAVVLLLLGCAYADNNTDTCLEPWDSGPWGSVLEEWALSAPKNSDRHGRVMSLPPAPGYYVTDRVDRPPPPPHSMGPPPPGPQGPVPYDEWQPPSPTEAGKILNRPTGETYPDKPFKPSPAYPTSPNQIPPSHHTPSHQQQQPPFQQQNHPPYQQQHQPPYQQQQPSYQQQKPPYQQQQPPYQQQQPPYQQQQKPPFQQQQQNPHRGPGPMPSPVDRVDEPPKKQVTETDLYLLGAIEKLVYRVDLMEKRLRRLEENVHYLVSGVDHKPEPCVANFSRVGDVCYHFSSEATDWKTANLYCRKLRSNLLELDSAEERRRIFAAMLGDKRIRGMDVWTGGLNPGLLWIWSHSARPVAGNGTAGAGGAGGNSSVTIVGEGRCLALVHDPASNTYVFRGQDCAFRHRYICEKEEEKAKLSNEITRAARQVKHGARQARLFITGERMGDHDDTLVS